MNVSEFKQFFAEIDKDVGRVPPSGDQWRQLQKAVASLDEDLPPADSTHAVRLSGYDKKYGAKAKT